MPLCSRKSRLLTTNDFLSQWLWRIAPPNYKLFSGVYVNDTMRGWDGSVDKVEYLTDDEVDRILNANKCNSPVVFKKRFCDDSL